MKKKLVLYGLVIIFTLVCSLTVLADELSDAQQKKRAVDSQINRVLQQKKEEALKKKELESKKKDLEKAQAAEDENYRQLLNEINALNEEIEKINQAVREAEDTYNTQKELLKARLRIMYENSDSSILQTLISSENIIEFFERLELTIAIAKNDRQLVEELNTAKLDVEYKKQLQEEKREQVKGEAEEKKKRLEQLSISRADIAEQIRKSQSELARLEKQEDELLKQSNQLVNLIKNLSTTKKYAGGSMLWPCSKTKKISSAYGMRFHPILKKNKMHTGIDIAAPKGESIVAANKGTVIMSGWQNGYGNTVVIDHGGGITTLYAHCSKLLVKVGQEVKAGEVIAKVGSTGLSTGPHLHFEVRKDGKTRNPLEYVSNK